MTQTQLTEVRNFMIEFRGVGKLVFPGITNLHGVQLDEVVVVKGQKFSLYPKKKLRPPLNEGLNKQVVVTMYNMPPKDGFAPADFEEMLRSDIEKKGGTHVKYDQVRFEWTFIMAKP